MATMKPAFSIGYIRPSDFSLMLTPSHRRGGDLTTPPVSPLCWPVQTNNADDALRRLEYSCLQQRAWFEKDPNSHCLKAVHPDNGEIVSIARWTFFPRGYDYERDEFVNVREFVAEEDLKTNGGVFDLELYREMRQGRIREKIEWMSVGKPYWVLMSMVTRDCYRKQGAARQLINWGVGKARKDGVPAYLEASAAGLPVYEKCGFRQVGQLTDFDCRPYGRDIVFNIAKMAWYPENE